MRAFFFLIFARAARKRESTECARSAQSARTASKRALSVLFARAARKGDPAECAQSARAARKVLAQRAKWALALTTRVHASC